MASRGIEALAHSRPTAPLEGTSIALPLLFGFTFMLVVEQLSSPHAHHHTRTHRSGHRAIAAAASPDSVFDVELAGSEDDGDVASHHQCTSFSGTNIERDPPSSPYPITIGLVVHSLADGLALGVSVLSSKSNNESSTSYGLSFVVFLALAVHKGKLIPKTWCPSVAHSVQLFSMLAQLLLPLLTPFL
jgi:solute carrier family 39 (zinc transporter), member 9